MGIGQIQQILCIQINTLGKLLKMSTNTVSREIKYLGLWTEQCLNVLLLLHSSTRFVQNCPVVKGENRTFLGEGKKMMITFERKHTCCYFNRRVCLRLLVDIHCRRRHICSLGILSKI